MPFKFTGDIQTVEFKLGTDNLSAADTPRSENSRWIMARQSSSVTGERLNGVIAKMRRFNMRILLIWAFMLVAFPLVSRAQVSTFEVTPISSTIDFDVEASVAIKGTFHKWDLSFTCTSTDTNKCILGNQNLG